MSGARPEPKAKRKSRARPAATYRAARRNAALRTKPKTTWGPQHYYRPSKRKSART